MHLVKYLAGIAINGVIEVSKSAKKLGKNKAALIEANTKEVGMDFLYMDEISASM